MISWRPLAPGSHRRKRLNADSLSEKLNLNGHPRDNWPTKGSGGASLHDAHRAFVRPGSGEMREPNALIRWIHVA